MNIEKHFAPVVVVLVAVIAFLAWQLHLSMDREQSMEKVVTTQSDQLVKLENQVVMLEKQVVELNKNTVQHVAKEANDAIVDGWEALVNIVEGEIKKARDTMHEAIDQVQKEREQEEREQNEGTQEQGTQEQGSQEQQEETYPNPQPDMPAIPQSQPQLESPDGTDRI